MKLDTLHDDSPVLSSFRRLAGIDHQDRDGLNNAGGMACAELAARGERSVNAVNFDAEDAGFDNEDAEFEDEDAGFDEDDAVPITGRRYLKGAAAMIRGNTITYHRI
ncbi:hypothetical protein [Pontixanthobacter sp.]|uniref:hypothetical protein n=1 Tax=Pontixanthobacter sp. TaxID=2792078 RepID=UPI003C7D742F